MGVDFKEWLETSSDTALDDPIYAHIVEANDEMSAGARILEASISGIAITALCGYTWVPSRDPHKYPPCPKCMELFEMAKDLRS